MIAIVDYGMGNLRSVEKALQHVGGDAQIVEHPDQLALADKVVLPGVGAFKDAMTHLGERDLIEPIKAFAASGKPFMGICLGLQLLFDRSSEDGDHEGLGILPGRVVRFDLDDATLKVPHMGWNALAFDQPVDGQGCPLLRGLTPGDHVYFVHSYFAVPDDASIVSMTADYGGPFCASVHRGNVMATQFHPEKSQHVGLAMLRNFVEL